MNETSEEEELSQCPFSKREKKLFENNNEKISPVCLNILAIVTNFYQVFRYHFDWLLK